MSNLRPNGKDVVSQRDKEIFELINLLIEKGYSASSIYEKLSRATGLAATSITYIRFKELKKLSDQPKPQI